MFTKKGIRVNEHAASRGSKGDSLVGVSITGGVGGRKSWVSDVDNYLKGTQLT